MKIAILSLQYQEKELVNDSVCKMHSTASAEKTRQYQKKRLTAAFLKKGRCVIRGMFTIG